MTNDKKTMMHLSSVRIACNAFGLFAVFLPVICNAQWSAAPNIAAAYEHDDNASLGRTAAEKESVSGYLLEAAADLTYNSELTSFTLTPRVLISEYESDSDLDSDDYFLNFDYGYKGQRSGFVFRGKYSNESTRTAERSDVDFEPDDPDDIPDDNSGDLLMTEKRQRIRLSPEWSYRMSPRSTIRLGANYIDANYEEGDVQPYTDYTESKGLLSLEFHRAPRNTLFVFAAYRESEFPIFDSDFSGYEAGIGSRWQLSEQSQVVFRIGNDSTEDSTGEKQNNVIGELSLTKNLETSRILLFYRRNVSANGGGDLALRDTVNLSFTRDFSERFAINAGVRAYQTSALDSGLQGVDERDWLQIRGVASWRLSQIVTLELDYAYTRLDRESLIDEDDSNRVRLWLRFGRTN